MMSFLGNQYCLETDNGDYFIDLVFHHRKLECLIAIELEVGEFLTEYHDKMKFYLATLDTRVKLPHENFSIGIILCKSKNGNIVKYALRELNDSDIAPIYHITSTPPQQIKNQLPKPEQIAIFF